ncbi:MAG: hypothetical protein Fur0034_17800 [Desulfuromonadia bacterium]
MTSGSRDLSADERFELERLTTEKELLERRLAKKASYIRSKVDQMLSVMGTKPLLPDELDDESLIETDPLGILIDSFHHILDHLHQTNRRLEENHHFLDTILTNVQAGIVLIRERDFVIVDINPAALSIVGRTRDEAIGHSCFRFICPRCNGECPMQEDVKNRETRERRVLGANGEEIPVIKSVMRVTLGNESHFVESFIDVTPQKRAEEQLRILNDELESRVAERTRELEGFCYSMSHDLRAPLRHINSFARIVLEEYGERIDDEGREHLHRIERAAKRMGLLVDDLLLYARMSRMELLESATDLTAIAREVVAMLKGSDPDRQVEVQIQEGLTGRGDRSMLLIVLQNLIDNAWKYSRPVEHPRIEIGSFEQNGTTIFFVRDNGVGFDMRYRDKLFKVFERLHGDQFEGTGIGLAGVKRLIERQGGEIWAESEPGKGSTFYFTLGGKP